MRLLLYLFYFFFLFIDSAGSVYADIENVKKEAGIEDGHVKKLAAQFESKNTQQSGSNSLAAQTEGIKQNSEQKQENTQQSGSNSLAAQLAGMKQNSEQKQTSEGSLSKVFEQNKRVNS